MNKAGEAILTVTGMSFRSAWIKQLFRLWKSCFNSASLQVHCPVTVSALKGLKGREKLETIEQGRGSNTSLELDMSRAFRFYGKTHWKLKFPQSFSNSLHLHFSCPTARLLPYKAEGKTKEKEKNALDKVYNL